MWGSGRQIYDLVTVRLHLAYGNTEAEFVFTVVGLKYGTEKADGAGVHSPSCAAQSGDYCKDVVKLHRTIQMQCV